MPAGGAYFVLPSCIALIAACLIGSGVSKSGSPAPSAMMSRPARFNSAALVVTAMVGDGLMRSRREAMKDMTVSRGWLCGGEIARTGAANLRRTYAYFKGPCWDLGRDSGARGGTAARSE